MAGFDTIIYFDMRAPDFGTPAKELYPAALDMAQFADEIGVDRIALMEHHGSDDGYLPNNFIMGAAVAARTKRIGILLSAVILPLHDPLKVAEDITVLDNLSGGRLEVIFGAGYVKYEFDRFHQSLTQRGKRMDAGIDLIIRALSGETFEADGREVFVLPRPVRDPRDIILVGGGVKLAAHRAARFGTGFAPINPNLFPIYIEEMEKNGFPLKRMHPPARPLGIHLAEDIDEGWKELTAHAVHVAAGYAEWAKADGAQRSAFFGLDTEEKLKESGIFTVWTPDQLLEKAAKMERGNLAFQPLLGGLSPEAGWRSLKLLQKVMPKLQALRQS